MSDLKDKVVEDRVEDLDVTSSRAPEVFAASQLLKDFEARQHAMTKKEAIVKNWKSLLWCELALWPWMELDMLCRFLY